MPKFTPNAIIKDCWSPIGNITFYHRNGQCFYKRKIKPVFPGTPAQLDQAQVHHRAILAWQQLPHTVQLQWRDLTFNLTQKGQSPLCAHIRYRLIDELTGYRNNWQRLPH